MVIMRYSIRRRNNKSNKVTGAFPLLILLVFAAIHSYAFAVEKNGDPEPVKTKLSPREVFANLKSQPLDILPVSARLDMLDYWDADSIKKVSNALQGLSWLDTVGDSYLKVNVTSVSTFEIKILPAKHGEMVMTIYTIGDDVQAQDSQVDFYDGSLILLDTSKYLDMPVLKDYFDIPKGSITDMKEIKGMIPFPTVKYSASDDSNDLVSALTVKEFVNQDDWNIIKLFIKPSITLEWKKDRYKFRK